MANAANTQLDHCGGSSKGAATRLRRVARTPLL